MCFDTEDALKKAKGDEEEHPEAIALKVNIDTLATRLAGSLTNIANEAWGKGLLDDDQKSISDPHASHDRNMSLSS